MIGMLQGILALKKPPFLMIDVNGVGYELQASMTTIYQLPSVGNPIVLQTHMIVRDDAFLLYGFHDDRERAVFRELIKVSGVGPKLALAILSGMDVNAFIACIEQRDSALLKKLPGVGAKTAERVVVEMQGRLGKNDTIANKLFSEKLFESKGEQNQNLVEQDAISALIALGYKPQEANRAIRRVAEEGADSETLIRLALKNLAQ